KILRRELGQHTRIPWIAEVRLPSLQVEHHARNLAELMGSFDAGMGGEYLFDQRGASARQADDENRIRAFVANTIAAGEELARADFDLFARTGFGDLGAVAALGPFELIALAVIAPGLGVVSAIFEGFAKREAQVVAVDRLRGWRRFRGAHAGDLVVVK